MKNTLSLLLSIVNFCVFAQHKITGLVLDKNQNPIPYTSVFDPNHGNGTNTGIDGYFLLEVKKTPTILRFGNVGYYPLDKEVNSYDTIKVILKQRIIMLNEVNVYSSEPESSHIGCPKKTHRNYFYTADKAHYQLALKVDNYNQELYKESNLISFSIKILYNNLLSNSLVKPNGEKQLRLRIYEIDTLETVGKDIFHENVFLKPSKGGWYRVTFPSPFLLPEKGFFIAIEWLETMDFLTNKKRSKFEYYPQYGIEIFGHKLKDNTKDLQYYSSWLYDPEKHKWEKDSNILIDWNNIIPTFRLEIKEYK